MTAKINSTFLSTNERANNARNIWLTNTTKVFGVENPLISCKGIYNVPGTHDKCFTIEVKLKAINLNLVLGLQANSFAEIVDI